MQIRPYLLSSTLFGLTASGLFLLVMRSAGRVDRRAQLPSEPALLFIVLFIVFGLAGLLVQSSLRQASEGWRRIAIVASVLAVVAALLYAKNEAATSLHFSLLAAPYSAIALSISLLLLGVLQWLVGGFSKKSEHLPPRV